MEPKVISLERSMITSQAGNQTQQPRISSPLSSLYSLSYTLVKRLFGSFNCKPHYVSSYFIFQVVDHFGVRSDLVLISEFQINNGNYELITF